MELTASTVSLSSVYAATLVGRPVPEGDVYRQKTALLELVAKMHDAPADILPKFVDLALELTGGISAGLSILEESPSASVFRWHHLRGILSPFDGATTPRDFSPCGVTLDRNAPTLATHPEHVYDWIPDHLMLPEVLLVPLYVGRTEPLGTLWIVSDRIGHFHSGHAATMQELATFIGMALKMVLAEQELSRALEQQELLTREMSHRLKNVFAVVDGMIRISARSATDKDQLLQTLSGRLRALATAHSLVRRSFSDVHGTASDLGELLKFIVEPHEAPGSEGDRKKFSIFGSSVQCGEQAISGLALVFHELATNAVKYGALASEGGTVNISWRTKADELEIVWTERGGSVVEPLPEATGFGSTLVESTIVRQFGGTLHRTWRPDGLAAEIKLPLAKLVH